MKIKKNGLVFCVMVCMLLAACRQDTVKESAESSKNAEIGESIQTADVIKEEETMPEKLVSSSNSEASHYAENDFYTDYDRESVSYIELKEETINFSGSGAFVQNNVITISSAGTYVVNGTLRNGQIIIDENAEGVVRLILNGISIHCDTGAPLFVADAGKVILSLENGTNNVFSDGSSYTEKMTENATGTIFSSSDLTINGTGNLTVEGNYQNGIVCKGQLIVMEGGITVTAKKDGILGEEAMMIRDGTFLITASNNALESYDGNMFIENGDFQMASGAQKEPQE